MFQNLVNWWENSELKELYRIYINPPSRSEEEEKQFMKDVREIERLVMTAILLLGIIIVIFISPTDWFLFKGEILLAFIKWRIWGGVIGGICLLLAYLNETVRSYSSEWYAFNGGLVVLGVAYFLGETSLSISSWQKSAFFTWSYIIPGLTAFWISFQLIKRIFFNLYAAICVFGGFFVLNPQNFNLGFFSVTLMVYSSLILLSVIGGHVIHNLYRRSYFLQLELEKERDNVEEKHKKTKELMNETLTDEERRRFIRFNPDKNSILSVSSNQYTDGEELLGLIRDVSKGGCGAVFHERHFDFEVGESVYLNTNIHEEKNSNIVWIRNLDKQFIKVGFEYFEDLDEVEK